jgi:hypothetical protein
MDFKSTPLEAIEKRRLAETPGLFVRGRANRGALK